MNILFVSNNKATQKKCTDILSLEGISAQALTYNEIILRRISFGEVTLVVLHAQDTTDLRQLLTITHEKLILAPIVILWNAGTAVPASVKDTCNHVLTHHIDATFGRKIKELGFQATINDLYNTGNNVVEYHGLLLDRRYRELHIGTRTIKLRNKEFALIEFFMLNPERLLCRNTILESVWDINKTFMTNTIDVHIGKLRKLLGDDHKHLIRTIHSIGYIFG